MHSNYHLLIMVDSKFDDVMFTYKDEKGNLCKFYKVPERNLNWDVTVTGVAASDNAKLGVMTGDEVVFSYQVISDRKWHDADQIFQKTIETEGIMTEWTDGSGAMIRKIKSPFPGKWDAFALDRKGKLLGRASGSEDVCERFLAQFNFSNVKGRFVNLFEVDGKDLWRAKNEYVLGVKRDGKIHLFHDMVLVKQIYTDLTTRAELSSGIKLPQNYIQMKHKDMGMVVSGENEGCIISFEDRYAQKYKLWGEDYLLVRKNRVFGIWS